MIYIAENVPLAVKDLFSQRAERYLSLLKEIGNKTHEYYQNSRMSDEEINIVSNEMNHFFNNPYSAEIFDGYPCCDMVFEIVSTALNDRKLETTIVVGSYKKDGALEAMVHEWFYLWVDRKTYSIDMTHRQTGSDKMIVAIPSDIEKDFGLRRLFKKRISGSAAEMYSYVVGEYADELYHLFRY